MSDEQNWLRNLAKFELTESKETIKFSEKDETMTALLETIGDLHTEMKALGIKVNPLDATKKYNKEEFAEIIGECSKLLTKEKKSIKENINVDLGTSNMFVTKENGKQKSVEFV